VPRKRYQQQLEDLQHELLEMGEMVDRALDQSMQALLDRDVMRARRVVDGDAAIDAFDFHLQSECMVVLAQQAPMASDLRLVVSVGAVSLELERIADHAAGIGKIVLLMEDEPLVKPLIDLPAMAERAREMLSLSLDAFVQRDTETASRLGPMDDDVDQLHQRIYRDLVEIMVSDPTTIEPSTHLLWVAHNLERVADRPQHSVIRAEVTERPLCPLRDLHGLIPGGTSAARVRRG
jgi:phosphate transport system protein